MSGVNPSKSTLGVVSFLNPAYRTVARDVNELLATLTNLSYELFGVVLPGIVASIFILLYWITLGPVAPFWTCGIIPAFT